MNKLVIVGNGFDRAHNLSTAYKQFIDSFWKDLKSIYQDEIIEETVFINPEFFRLLSVNPISNFKDFLQNIDDYKTEYGCFFDEKNLILKDKKGMGSKLIFEFKNDFFKSLNLESLENWVEIENEYFKELKRISKRKNSHYSGGIEEFEKQQLLKNSQSVKKLNREFQNVKLLFKKYLLDYVHNVTDFIKLPNQSEDLLDFFDIDFIFQYKGKGNKNWVKYCSEFPQEEVLNLIKYADELIEFDSEIHSGASSLNDFDSIAQKLIFLNFNYTNSLKSYVKRLDEALYVNASEIKIHGQLENEENPINFGFGDEMDEDYRLIENLNDNEYLKNFKSFKYSQNTNYKNLLDYIDSDKFQVYIMGHSCGLADRTLLNTIFEHKNCRSIKVFYHQREDGSDNFTEIIQNISRHFKDKKEMRAKLVNKSLCEPLPQNIRFQKKNS